MITDGKRSKRELIYSQTQLWIIKTTESSCTIFHKGKWKKKWQISEQGEETCKMILKHFVMPKPKKLLKEWKSSKLTSQPVRASIGQA